MAVAGEAACRAAALSPPDRASLGRLGIRDDLRVEFWFNPSGLMAGVLSFAPAVFWGAAVPY